MATTAQSYAQTQADLLKQQLAGLYDNLAKSTTEQTTSAAANKQQLLDTINTNKATTESDYQADAKSAYINKMLSGNTIDSEMQRLGLNTSGFGVGEVMKNETAYGQNLTSLQKQKASDMTGYNTDTLNAENDYISNVADINSTNAQNKLALDQYINEQVDAKYQQEYENKTNAEQQAYENTTKAAQQKVENSQAWSQINNSNTKDNTYEPQTYTNQKIKTYETGVTGVLNSNGKNYTYTTSNGDKYTLAKGVNPWTGTINSDAKGVGNTFNGGYQPNNYKGVPLKKTRDRVPVNGQTQNVWKAGSKTYVWDGTQNKYLRVKQSNGNWVVV